MKINVICKLFTEIKASFYRFASNPIVLSYSQLCVQLEPITLFFASYVIVDFFYRVSAGYRYYHKSAHQKVNIFNFLLTFAPVVISLFFLFTQEGISSCFFGFTFVSDALSILYPIVVQRKTHIIGSFFQITLLLGSLYYIKFRYIYFFLLSIPFAFIVFKNEKSQIDYFRRYVLAPGLLIAFIGVIVSYNETTSAYVAISIFSGSFVGLIFSD